MSLHLLASPFLLRNSPSNSTFLSLDGMFLGFDRGAVAQCHLSVDHDAQFGNGDS